MSYQAMHTTEPLANDHEAAATADTTRQRKPPRTEEQMAKAPAAGNLFAGHTPDEAFLFFVSATWFFMPIMLLFFPDYFNWHMRSPGLLVPYSSPFNSVASWLHWYDYQAHGPRQLADITLCGCFLCLMSYDAYRMWWLDAFTADEKVLLLIMGGMM